VVADALSRKTYEKAAPKSAQLQEEMARLNVHIVPQGYVRQLSVQPTLEEKIPDRPSWAVEPAWVATPPRQVFGLGFVAQPSNPVVFW
jgi:hypothetical protein